MQQPQPQWPQQLAAVPTARKLGALPTVGLVVGACAAIVVAIATAWTLSPRNGYLSPSVAQPPVVYGGHAGVPAAPPTDATPLPKAPTKGLDLGTSPALSAVLPRIEAFVEESRGHRFQRQVTVTSLADKAFLAQLHKGSGSGADVSAQIDGEDATLEALHLLPRHTDLAATLAAQRDQSVGGFYDPVTKQLFVRGTTLNPLGQTIVAHELTHALDDQYFDLRKLQDQSRNSDQDQAIRSLIEGDARSVENRFRAALVPAERTLVDAEEKAEFGPAAGAAQPPIFLELDSAFPYEVGARFVDYLRGHGGTRTLDKAFMVPPSSTLQILDPRGAFLQRADPITYADGGKVQGAPGTTVSQDTLGAFGLAAVLSEKSPLALLHQTATVESWNGDHYLTLRSGSRVCVRDTISTRGSPDVLYEALSSWTGVHPGASVTKTKGGTLLFVSCVG
jgi:hypothetical protein